MTEDEVWLAGYLTAKSGITVVGGGGSRRRAAAVRISLKAQGDDDGIALAARVMDAKLLFPRAGGRAVMVQGAKADFIMRRVWNRLSMKKRKDYRQAVLRTLEINGYVEQRVDRWLHLGLIDRDGALVKSRLEDLLGATGRASGAKGRATRNTQRIVGIEDLVRLKKELFEHRNA